MSQLRERIAGWPGHRWAAGLAILYLIFGAVWVATTDVFLLPLDGSPQTLIQYQSIKGVAYVVITALIAYVYLERMLGKQDRTMDALTQSELKYRDLVQHANSIIMRWTRDGQITFVNEYGLRFFGYEESELVGRHVVGTIVPETESTGRDLRPLMDRICANPKAFEFNVNENMRRDGAKVWISWTNKVSFDAQGNIDGILSIGTDITESRNAETALRESEARYRGLFEDCPASLWEEDFSGVKSYLDELRASGVTDLRAHFESYPAALRECADLVKILDVNRATLELLQYERREDLCGRLGSVLREETYELFRRELLSLSAGQLVFQTEAINHNRWGEKFHVTLTLAVVPGHEATWARVFVALTDITARVQAEEKLLQLNTELEQRVAERTAELAHAKERAESADRLKSAFLAAMSHELRTPLNSIIGFTGILMEELPGPLNNEQAKQLGMVQNSAMHLLELINDVLDLSKIEAGQMTIQRDYFDPHESVGRVMHLFKPIAEKKRLSLKAEVPPSLTSLYSDRRRFEQVLINLVNNGLKFTNEGGVRVTFVDEGERLAIHVADTGIGIKSEDRQKLFQSFQQLDSGLSRNHEGTGLGLAICSKLASLLGGTIEVRSEWGAGSTFTFLLPVERGPFPVEPQP
ncbi:MAG: hypothetical protein AMXMBFR84_26890 [Candidatus Hydrogenedentota bacterium]